MTRLVVNADDLGLHPCIDEGIFTARERGIVTSASLLVTGRTAPQAARRATQLGLGLGLHFALTTHLPPAAAVADVRWLAPGGRFRRNWAELARAWLVRLVPSEEVELELRAQLDRAAQLGVRIDHLDTHQHLHLLPGVTDIVERIAAERGLPVRWPTERPHREWLRAPGPALKSLLLRGLGAVKAPSAAVRVPTVGIFESGRLTEKRLLRLIDRLDGDAWELACHPGYEPGEVPEDRDWRYGWEAELAAVTSAAARERLSARAIELVTYAAL